MAGGELLLERGDVLTDQHCHRGREGRLRGAPVGARRIERATQAKLELSELLCGLLLELRVGPIAPVLEASNQPRQTWATSQLCQMAPDPHQLHLGVTAGHAAQVLGAEQPIQRRAGPTYRTRELQQAGATLAKLEEWSVGA